MVRYAGTVSALGGTGVLHRTMDRTIVGIVFGPQAIAVVEVASQIQMGSTALLSASTYPVLSTAPWLAARQDLPALRDLLDRATRYSVLLTLPLVALIVVFAGPFVRLWVGEGYGEAIGLTQVAVLYVAVTAPLAAGSNLLQGIGHAGAVLRAAIFSVAVNLVASIVMVHAVGTVGVFIGSILGALALAPLLLASIDRYTGSRSLRLGLVALARALPPSAVVVGIGWLLVALLPSDFLAMSIGGAAATAAAVVVAGLWSLRADERREIVHSLRSSE
jgi:O-antigen/teichoic acid export membrane protein